MDKILDEPTSTDFDSSNSKTVRILYCASWSYGNIYQQFRAQIRRMYPNTEVYGSEYPLGPTKKIISTVLTYTQYGFIGLMMFGGRIPAVAEHPLYLRVQQNRWMYFIGAYLLTNTAQKFLTQSGAFEVYINDELVFSKLTQNRMPTIQEIMTKMKQYWLHMIDDW